MYLTDIQLDYNVSRQLLEAQIMYQEARDKLELLSHAHKKDVPAWSRVPRCPKQSTKSTKSWMSVYHQHQTKIPTVRQLLVSLSREENSSIPENMFLSESEVTVTLEAYWLKAIEAENIWYIAFRI